MDRNTCARHDATRTRLSCSSCEVPICPECAVESAVGYKCPDCGTFGGATGASRRSGPGRPAGLGIGGTGSSARSGTSARQASARSALGAVLVGLAASVGGGLVLGFVFAARTFFLISSGVVGWAVARIVYRADDDRGGPVVRAAALALAGLSVVVGMLTAPGTIAGPDPVLYLAVPAAVYGAWIVVRQR